MTNPEPRTGEFFDFERLIVYRKALGLARMLAPFLGNPPRKSAGLCDQLDRALDSVLLNVPEGAGRAPGSRDRVHFYRIALGSAKEAASALVCLRAKGRMDGALYFPARALMLEIIRMLSAMARS